VTAVGRPSRQLLALPVLTRWRTCLTGSVLFVLGSQWQAGHAGPLVLAAGGAAVWLSVAQAEVLNDVADRSADAVDKPQRPIPSGAITVPFALAVYGGASVASVLLGWQVSPGVCAAMAVLVGASALYCLVLKSTVLAGNVLVAAMASSPLLIGAQAAGPLRRPTLLAALLVSLFMLSFEVVKTAVDVVGDGTAGLTTVGTALGVRAALKIATLAFGADCAVAGLLTLTSPGPRGPAFAVVFVVLVAAPALRRYAAALTVPDPTPADAADVARTLGGLWKYGMLCLVLLT